MAVSLFPKGLARANKLASLFGDSFLTKNPIGTDMGGNADDDNSGALSMMADAGGNSGPLPQLGGISKLFPNSGALDTMADDAPQTSNMAAKSNLFASNDTSSPNVKTDALTVPRQSQDYSYGLGAPPKMPHTPKWQDILNTVLGIGVPAIASMRNNTGLIPGAFEGYAGVEAGKSEAAQRALSQYDTERSFRQKDQLERLKIQDQKDKEAFDQTYKTGMLGVAQQNAGTNADRVVVAANKKSTADKKLQDIDSYATTLNDQIHKMMNDAQQIPGYGLGSGSVATYLGKSGLAPWSGAQTDFEAKQTPISDVLAKMTSGRANQQIIKNINDKLDVLKTGSPSQKAAAGPAILDYIDTEYRNSQLAHGVAPEDVKSLTDLNKTADTIPQSSGRIQPGSDVHSQAIQWAKQNPNDPRAAKILKLNGVQ